MTDEGYALEGGRRSIAAGCHVVVTLKKPLIGEITCAGWLAAVDKHGIRLIESLFGKPARGGFQTFVPWSMIKGALLVDSEEDRSEFEEAAAHWESASRR